MATSTATSILTDAARARARAEAVETLAMRGYRDAEMARTAHVEPPMRRLVERSAIALTIGEAMGLSEGQVQHRLSVADTLRDQSPTTWDAFLDGRIDLGRAREIAHTVKQLKRVSDRRCPVPRIRRPVLPRHPQHRPVFSSQCLPSTRMHGPRQPVRYRPPGTPSRRPDQRRQPRPVLSKTSQPQGTRPSALVDQPTSTADTTGRHRVVQ